MSDFKAQNITEACAAIVDCISALFDTVASMMADLAASLQTIFREIALQCTDIFEALMVASAIELGIPAKWLYIYRHTKKRRTKKKYRKLIFDAALAFMEAEQ